LPESDIGDTFPTYAPLWPDLAAGSLGGQKNLSPPVSHWGGRLFQQAPIPILGI